MENAFLHPVLVAPEVRPQIEVEEESSGEVLAKPIEPIPP